MIRIFKLVLIFATLGAAPCGAEPSASYPSLDAKALGHVRNIVALAEQPGFENMDDGPRGAFDQYQFQLAWMYYALAIAQTQRTPAYREMYKQASDRLIQKMLRPEVWGFWLTVIEDPHFKKYLDKSSEWRDPVREKNIMYSGHLLQMIGLYQRLYGDGKYTAPGSVVFEIADPEGFRSSYDFRSLAENIRAQFIDSELQGVECEPNFIFAECNQHPILGLIDYDKIYGTHLADIRSGFWAEAERLGFLNKQTSRFAGPHLKQEATTGKLAVAWNDGWTGLTLHAWNPEAVRMIYPMQRDAELGALIDQDPKVWSVRWSKASVSTDFGFLAAYAAEMGDRGTVRTLLDYADARFAPVDVNDRYYYPRHDVPTEALQERITGQESAGPFSTRPSAPLKREQFGDHLVGPLTGNALLAFARINPGDGLWAMYNALEATYRPGEPELVNVAHDQVQVAQAYYDRLARRLVVALLQTDAGADRATFSIRNLDAGKTHRVFIDGQKIAEGKGKALVSSDSEVQLEWISPNSLSFSMMLHGGRQIVVENVGAGKKAARAR